VGNKKNKQWIWIAMDARSRQIVAFHVGDRSGESARKLWESIPKSYRDKATFYTDDWQAEPFQLIYLRTQSDWEGA
jgi:IS1 family transposase